MNRTSRVALFGLGIGAAAVFAAGPASAQDIEISFDGKDVVNTFPTNPFTGQPEQPAQSGPNNDLSQYTGPANFGTALHATTNAAGDANDVAIADHFGFANIGFASEPNSGATNSIATAFNGGTSFIGSFDGNSPVPITGDKAFSNNGGAIVLDSANSTAITFHTGINGSLIEDATNSAAVSTGACPDPNIVCSGSEADIFGTSTNVVNNSHSLETAGGVNQVTTSNTDTLNGAPATNGQVHSIENTALHEALAGVPSVISVGHGDNIAIMPLIHPIP